MRKDESGSIILEFIGSFLLFFLLIMSVLSLVNIVTVQARVHYALTQTANTLSMYGYILHTTGIDKLMIEIDRNTEKVRSGVNEQVNNINELFGSINSVDPGGIKSGAGSTWETFKSWGSGAKESPKDTIALLLGYGLGEVSSAGLQELLKPMMMRYLENGDETRGNYQSGKDYLESVGVVGGDLKFYEFSMPGYTRAGEGEFLGQVTGLATNNSVLLDKDGNVRLTVQYEIAYTFMGLPLPFGPTLSVTQTVMTKMWLGGSEHNKPLRYERATTQGQK